MTPYLSPTTDHRVLQRPRRSVRRRLPALFACAALVLAMTACGSSDSDADATTTTAPAKTVSTTNTDDAGGGASAAGTPIDNAVTITTPGMSYDVSGELRPGIGSITFENTSPETHMIAMGRLKDGATLDDLKKSLEKDEDATNALLADGPDNSNYGAPNLVGPGEHTTVTMTDLEEGTYGLICFLTSDDGTPHFAMGMVGELTVTGSPATETPTSDGTISIDDEAITMPTPFSGQGTFLVKNTGTAPHSIAMVRLDAGTTLDAYFGAVGQTMQTQKSVDDAKGGVLVGGIDTLDPGQSAYLTLDLDKGDYGYVSTAEDPSQGMPPQNGTFTV